MDEFRVESYEDLVDHFVSTESDTCTKCNAPSWALTAECPNVSIHPEDYVSIHMGRLNYVHGTWRLFRVSGDNSHLADTLN